MLSLFGYPVWAQLVNEQELFKKASEEDIRAACAHEDTC
jgi:hypothetical protein